VGNILGTAQPKANVATMHCQRRTLSHEGAAIAAYATLLHKGAATAASATSSRKCAVTAESARLSHESAVMAPSATSLHEGVVTALSMTSSHEGVAMAVAPCIIHGDIIISVRQKFVGIDGAGGMEIGQIGEECQITHGHIFCFFMLYFYSECSFFYWPRLENKAAPKKENGS
jgi:hypothetical protein